jgi:hypothetical protein
MNFQVAARRLVARQFVDGFLHLQNQQILVFPFDRLAAGKHFRFRQVGPRFGFVVFQRSLPLLSAVLVADIARFPALRLAAALRLPLRRAD